MSNLVARVAVVAAATLLCLGQAGQALADGGNDQTSLQQAADEASAQINDYIRSGSFFNNNTCYQKTIIPNRGGWTAVDGRNCS